MSCSRVVSVMTKINEQSILDGQLSQQDVIDLLNNRNELYSIIQDMKMAIFEGVFDYSTVATLEQILNNNVKLVSTNGKGVYDV